MELNEKVIGDLSSRLKIDSEALSKALTSEDAESVELNVTILTAEEKETLESNIKKQGYTEGKTAGEEMLFKNFKKSKGLDIEANNFDDYFTKFEEQTKAQFSGDIDEKLKERDLTISKLQQSIQEKDGLVESVKSEYETKLKGIKANNIIKSELNKLDFDVPKHIEALGETEISKYIDAKRNQTLTLFQNTYKADFDENNKAFFVDSQGNKLVNELQENLAINDLVKQFAKDNYLTISEQQRKGRGSKSKPHTSGNFRGMTNEQFFAHLKEKNININSKEGDSLYSEFVDANK